MSIDQLPLVEAKNHDAVMNIVIGIGDAVRRAKQQDLIQPPNPHQLGLPHAIVATPAGNCAKVYIEDLVAGEQYTFIPDTWNPLKARFGAALSDEMRLMVPLGTDNLQMRTVVRYTVPAPVISPAIPVIDPYKLGMLERHVEDLRPISADEYTSIFQERLVSFYEKKNTTNTRRFGARIIEFFRG